MSNSLRAFVDRADGAAVTIDELTFGERKNVSVFVTLRSDAAVERWQLRNAGRFDLKVMEGKNSPVRLCEAGHPLLAHLLEPLDELTFRGGVRSPDAVLGALWRAHRAWGGPWIPFGTFFDDRVALPELLTGGHGELVTGPRTYVAALGEVLRRYEVEASVRTVRDAADPAAHRTSAVTFGASNYVRAVRLAAEQVPAP